MTSEGRQIGVWLARCIPSDLTCPGHPHGRPIFLLLPTLLMVLYVKTEETQQNRMMRLGLPGKHFSERETRPMLCCELRCIFELLARCFPSTPTCPGHPRGQADPSAAADAAHGAGGPPAEEAAGAYDDIVLMDPLFST